MTAISKMQKNNDEGVPAKRQLSGGQNISRNHMIL